MDLRSVGSIEDAVSHVESEQGRLDILVNNAGLGTNHGALDVTEQEWDELMEGNLRGCSSPVRPQAGAWSRRVMAAS